MHLARSERLSGNGFIRRTVLGAAFCVAVGGISLMTGARLTEDPIESDDLNGDTVVDIVFADPEANDFTGIVTIEDGVDGRPLATIAGRAPGTYFGFSVVLAWDLSNGVNDLLIGAPWDANGRVYLFRGPFVGDAPLLSANDANALFELSFHNVSEFGNALGVLPDVDGDGFVELLILGFVNEESGALSARTYVLSSETGEVLVVLRHTETFDPWQYVEGYRDLESELDEWQLSAVVRQMLAAPRVAVGDRQDDPVKGEVAAAGEPCDCPEDFVDDNGVVDTVELLAMFGAWGACPDPPEECPADLTGDGVVDTQDMLVLFGAYGDCDSDDDGMGDNWEEANGLDPCDPSDAADDADEDGLANLDEYGLLTDPFNPDSDGDGTSDGAEVIGGSDPNDATDNGEGPNSEDVVYVMLTFGDQSCHFSETWRMELGGVIYEFTDAIEADCQEPPDAEGFCGDPWSCPLNAPRDKGPIPVERGREYSIRMHHYQTSFLNDPPDYDWTCLIDLVDEDGGNRRPLMEFHENGPGFEDDEWLPTVPIDGVFVDDPDLLMGQIWTDAASDPTVAKEAWLQPMDVNLRMDSNRNGMTEDDGSDDADEDLWEYGDTATGAIVVFNNDDDDENGAIDSSDSTINGATDVDDLRELRISRLPDALPVELKVKLRAISFGDKVRIFDALDVSANMVHDPNDWMRGMTGFEIPRESIVGEGDPLTYGIEAVAYPGGAFEGLVILELALVDEMDQTLWQDQLEIRVAPWMMPSHADTTIIEVMSTNADGARTNGMVFGRPSDAPDVPSFTHRVSDALAAANHGPAMPYNTGGPWNRGNNMSGDPWIQDQVEIGFHSWPVVGQGGQFDGWQRVVLDSPRAQISNYNLPRLNNFAKNVLLGPDFGLIDNVGIIDDGVNYFGNLEAFERATTTNPPRPHGRIYHGGPGMQAAITDFLSDQHLQPPQEFNVSWLTIGHVDEMFSIDSSQRRAYVAAPVLGWCVIAAHAIEEPDFVFTGGQLTNWTEDMDIAELGEPLRVANEAADASLEPVRATLAGLGYEIIDVPVVMHVVNGRATALLPNMVNMLNVGSTLIVPKPYYDRFEQELEARLPVGVAAQYVDSLERHWALGEVHCSTNIIREPGLEVRQWWLHEPQEVGP